VVLTRKETWATTYPKYNAGNIWWCDCFWYWPTYNYESFVQAVAYDGVEAHQMDEMKVAAGSMDWYWSSLPMTADGVRLFVAQTKPQTAEDTAAGRAQETNVTPVTFDEATSKLVTRTPWTIPGSHTDYSLATSGGLLLASKYSQLSTTKINTDGSLSNANVYDSPTSLWFPISEAKHDKDAIYLPAYEYGVEILER
jgi:hypothetical protein